MADRDDMAKDAERPRQVDEEGEEERPARRFAFTFPLGRYLRVIVIGLIALIVAVVVAFLVVSRSANPPAPPTSTAGMTKAPLADYELEQFKTNLADRDNPAYIQAEIVLGYDDKSNSNVNLKEELKARGNQIRDAINLILNSKTSQDLISVEGKEVLKREIMDKINDTLSSGRIERVYLKNFVVQTL